MIRPDRSFTQPLDWNGLYLAGQFIWKLWNTALYTVCKSSLAYVLAQSKTKGQTVRYRFKNETKTFWYHFRICLVENRLLKFGPESALLDKVEISSLDRAGVQLLVPPTWAETTLIRWIITSSWSGPLSLSFSSAGILRDLPWVHRSPNAMMYGWVHFQPVRHAACSFHYILRLPPLFSAKLGKTPINVGPLAFGLSVGIPCQRSSKTKAFTSKFCTRQLSVFTLLSAHSPPTSPSPPPHHSVRFVCKRL